MALIDGQSSCCSMNLKPTASSRHCCLGCSLPSLPALSSLPTDPNPPPAATPVLRSLRLLGLPCLPKDTLKTSLNMKNHKGGFVIAYFHFQEDLSASAASGGRYNKMTEMKTLSHIRMICQHQPNPDPLENKLTASAAVPLLATGIVGSD